VTVAPTGSDAKTAKGVAYHSCFGFVKDDKMMCSDGLQEAARLLALDRWAPIARRLAKVQVLRIDDISMVSAENMDVMYQLLRQSRPASAAPVVLYAFGDFLQLCPPFGKMAFTASCWTTVFGAAFLELTHVHRHGQPEFVAALHDARLGRCTAAVQALMDEWTVSDEANEALECEVLHLMPPHKDVVAHFATCLRRLCPDKRLPDLIAVDRVKEDHNRDRTVRVPNLDAISSDTIAAALINCVAPPRVPHCRGACVMLISN